MPERMFSKRTYALVCAILLVLTGTTLTLANVNLGVWNTPIALAIAVSKAALIGLFFMELKLSPPVQRIAIGTALLWLSILIVGILDDFLTRGWLPIPGK